MVLRPCGSLRRVLASGVLALLVFGGAPLYAQDGTQSSFFGHTLKGVVFDPTTYAPAIIQYDAMMRDWNTSQPFFARGYVEHNHRFTISGRPNDVPLSYSDGKQLILKDALTTLAVTAAQNATSRLIERALLERYPDHPKLVKTIGWIQRIAVASLMSYKLSEAHYRQAEVNARVARERGYR
jgi:hypothetical protein